MIVGRVGVHRRQPGQRHKTRARAPIERFENRDDLLDGVIASRFHGLLEHQTLRRHLDDKKTFLSFLTEHGSSRYKRRQGLECFKARIEPR